jgi:hypothetical protein
VDLLIGLGAFSTSLIRVMVSTSAGRRLGFQRSEYSHDTHYLLQGFSQNNLPSTSDTHYLLQGFSQNNLPSTSEQLTQKAAATIRNAR